MSLGEQYLKGAISIETYFNETLKNRIMFFDGAMGTMIQVLNTF